MKAAFWGPVNQSALKDRDDVLVYTSDAFTEPLSFAGNIEAKLFVSADTPDADWEVKLVDVRPHGYAENIATGILQGRYRDSLLQGQAVRGRASRAVHCALAWHRSRTRHRAARV